MNKRPDVFKPITDEQLRALSEKNGWVGKERGVEPEEVGITKAMQRAALLARLEQAMVEDRNALAPSEYFLDKCAAELPRQNGLANTTTAPSRTDLDALRAFITPSTTAQAREREAADERESNEQLDGFGEDPTPLDQFLREQRLKPISEEQHAAIAAAEPATRGAVVESILNGPRKLEALRAIIGARASMAAYEAENSGKGTGYGEDPTDWDAYQREREELAFLQQRDASVTDAQLVERMNNAPDMGGSIIAEHMQRATEPLKTWLLPPNPGPFGTLEQWQAWRKELLALGPETAGVDVELQIADKVIAGMQGDPQ